MNYNPIYTLYNHKFHSIIIRNSNINMIRLSFKHYGPKKLVASKNFPSNHRKSFMYITPKIGYEDSKMKNNGLGHSSHSPNPISLKLNQIVVMEKLPMWIGENYLGSIPLISKTERQQMGLFTP